jgi:hypothetical protein
VAKAKYEEWLTEDGLTKLQGWARAGLTDEQIAHNMGISTVTLYSYKNNHPNIFNALKQGKEVIDIQVENALLKRALGYEYEEVTTTTNYKGEEEIKKVVKQIAPDTTAQIFWLKNRKPDEWRDKKDVELSGSISVADALKKARERVANGCKKD